MRKLDFIVIGAAKSGTTSLFHYLRGHPAVSIPQKEAPFFSIDERYDAGLDDYVESVFAGQNVATLWGKATPQYMGDAWVPERMSRDMPNVKLIALLRNPIDRALSHYRMQVRLGEEDRSFEQVVRNVTRMTHSDLMDRRLYEHYIGRSMYGHILDRYRDYFDSGQILVLFTEDLERDPQGTLRKVHDYLGVQHVVPSNLGKKYYQGGNRRRLPWLEPALQSVKPLAYVAKALVPRSVRTRFWWKLRELQVDKSRPEPLKPSTRTMLADYFRPDVMVLQSDIAHRNVPWGDFVDDPQWSTTDGS